jgi:hypothetical protein
MRTFLSALAGVLAIAAITAAPAGAQRSISCSSDNGKRHYCEVDTRGGVSMVRQRSDTECQEGYSWDYDRRGIWVDHGCRADFVVNSSEYGAPQSTPTIRREADAYLRVGGRPAARLPRRYPPRRADVSSTEQRALYGRL